MKKINKDKEKIGMATVVATLLLILIAVTLVGVLWVVVNNITEKKLEQSESCFDIFGKVSLNDQYTCYNATSNYLLFSVDIGDKEIQELLVSVSAVGQTKSFKITYTNKTVTDVRPYNKPYTQVALPAKNSGLTYIYNLTSAGMGRPDSIKIAPVVNRNQCDASDTLTEVDNCFFI